MTTAVVTTICRHSAVTESSGFIYTVDVEENKITGRAPIPEPPHREIDPNPRGGLRGGRGIAVDAESVYIANNSAIYRYDTQWMLRSRITHQACANIHDIALKEDQIWATASGNDMLIAFDRRGRIADVEYVRTWAPKLKTLSWFPTLLLDEKDVADGALDFRNPQAYDMDKHDGAHLNSLCFLENGDALIMLGLLWTTRFKRLFAIKGLLMKTGLWMPLTKGVKSAMSLVGKRTDNKNEMGFAVATGRSAVVRLSATGDVSLVFVIEGTHVPTHSLRLVDHQEAICLNSSTGEIFLFNYASGKVLSVFKVTDEYLRGGVALGSHRALVGCQNKLAMVDLKAQELVSSLVLSENPKESVYDVNLLAPGFSKMPAALPTESSVDAQC